MSKYVHWQKKKNPSFCPKQIFQNSATHAYTHPFVFKTYIYKRTHLYTEFEYFSKTALCPLLKHTNKVEWSTFTV